MRSSVEITPRWIITGRCGWPILADVLQLEALRQREVDLDRRDRLLLAERIRHLDVDLRAVERGLAGALVVRQAS